MTKHTNAEVNEICEDGLLDGEPFGNLGEAGGADVQSNYEYAKIENVATIFPATVDFWNYAKCYGGVDPIDWSWTTSTGYDYEGDYDLYIAAGTTTQFQSSGDAVQLNKWTQWDTGESIASDGTCISTRLGSPTTGTLPTLEAPPGLPGSNYNWTAYAVAGYSVTAAVAVINWQFTYVG